MIEQLQTRLKELREEFDQGQKTLADLDGQSADLRQMLLRISGAVQVLQEEIAKAEAAATVTGTAKN